MIEINLLSEELKIKPRAKKAGLGINIKYVIYFIPLVLGTLICVHIYLAILNVMKNSQLHMLNNKWLILEPQRKVLDNFNKEYKTISEDTLAVKQFTEQRVNWAEKLNKLSLDLPYGIWFNEFTLSQKDFILQGSVVSLQKEEFSLIKEFVDKLKNDTAFFKDFNNLEFSSAQKKTIGIYDVVDFILTSTLKSR